MMYEAGGGELWERCMMYEAVVGGGGELWERCMMYEAVVGGGGSYGRDV